MRRDETGGMPEGYLDERLITYSKEDIYPFHMPGHKRQASGLPDPYRIDITEIDGFDNLHHAEGILKEAQQRAAELYGSKRCYYLVNGSTCGILAAVCAAARGGKILMARNCHKAVWHAAQIGGIETDDLYPVITGTDLQGQITPRQVEEALDRGGRCVKEHAEGGGGEAGRPDTGYKAVVITSPTYEGVISDIAGIAAVCHARGIPLIVDSAHGAHLGIRSDCPPLRRDAAEAGAHGEHLGIRSDCPPLRRDAADAGAHGAYPGIGQGYRRFPENAVSAGADAVIMSLHKTLPSPTQTALLHLTSDRIDVERVEHYLDIFETSSPSYLLMAGMDACIRRLRREGAELFARCRSLLDTFYREVRGLRCLHVMQREDLAPEEAYDWDDSKLVIFAEGRGSELHQILRERYRLQMEMASGNYVLGMTSVADTAEGFARLTTALREIDAAWSAEAWGGAGRSVHGTPGSIPSQFHGARADEAGRPERGRGFTARMYAPNERRLPLWQAMDLPARECPFAEAEGKLCADFIALYPPGIPLIVPGEVISRDFLERIDICTRMGLPMECRSDLAARRIKIVYV